MVLSGIEWSMFGIHTPDYSKLAINSTGKKDWLDIMYCNTEV